jgi:hypothetical protein
MIPPSQQNGPAAPASAEPAGDAGVGHRPETVRGVALLERMPPETFTAAFRVFTVLWAGATLFHQIAYPNRHVGVFRYALTIAALWVLLRPSSVVRLAVLAVAQLALVAYYMPQFVTNHWIFTSFVNLTILAAMAVVAWRSRSLRIEGGELFATYAPFVRIEVLILYFYAVLHKLNTDFLAPASSCAMDHYTAIAARYPMLPTGGWVAVAAIWGTLVVEAAIPLMLVFRRTRVAGVLLGIAFHFLLAMNPEHRFYNFSAMIFAAYFLFVPFDYTRSVRALAERFAVGRRLLAQAGTGELQGHIRQVLTGAIALLTVLFLVGFDQNRYRILIGAIVYGNRVLWMVYGGALLVVFAYAVVRWNVTDASARLVSFRPRPAILLAFPALVLLNGFSPYLGLKTETSFSMFSNLRTEAGVSNHLFLPRSFRIAGYQDDLVEIVESSERSFSRFAEEGKVLPYLEFHRRAAMNPEHRVSYERAGELHVVDRIADHPELATPPPLLQRKLGHFRPIAVSGAPIECSH